jgi:FkbM family methyltransferase
MEIKVIKNFFDIKIIEGSYFKYFYVRLENYLRFLLKLERKIRKDEFMIIKNKLGVFKINLANDSVSKSNPLYESNLHKWIPENKNLFIDIGSNFGTYTILALKKKKYNKVISFEPNKEVFLLLKKNVELNKLEEFTTLENIGLGEKEKEVYFKCEKNHTGVSRIVKEKTEENIKIKIISLDIYLLKNNINSKDIDFIKIDVEGYEKNVLEGMKKTLNQLKKGTKIQIEIWRKHPNAEKTKNLILKNNFKLIENYMDENLFEKIN